MTKKANVGGVNNLASALQSAGVTASDIVVTPAAPAAASVDAQQQQQQPAPASPQAAIEAAQSLEEEIAAAKKVWEHAKTTGISKDQFLAFCQIDAEKFAFYMTHKKAIFGSKKRQLDEAAEVVVNAASKPSTKSVKVKKNKKLTARANKVGRAIFAEIRKTL